MSGLLLSGALLWLCFGLWKVQHSDEQRRSRVLFALSLFFSLSLSLSTVRLLFNTLLI